MDKKIAYTKAGLKGKINFKDNSTANQRKKVFNYLIEHGLATVDEFKTKLDVLAPPARIKELRDQGYQIDTVWKYWISDHGIKHRIGVYVLRSTEPLKQACEVAS